MMNYTKVWRLSGSTAHGVARSESRGAETEGLLSIDLGFRL